MKTTLVSLVSQCHGEKVKTGLFRIKRLKQYRMQGPEVDSDLNKLSVNDV